MAEPCGWTVARCACSTECWTKRSPATRERATALAAHFMWSATGRRYGPCEVTVLPCNPAPAEPLYQTYGLTAEPDPGPIFANGTVTSAACGPDCCSPRCEVELPGPVAQDGIIEVLIDGDPVAPDEYRVYDGRLLARIGGCWPTCNTYGEIPGFQVTYLRGTPIPEAVQYAFEGLACQIGKACEGASDCALPARMRSLTRQGVSVEMATEQATSQGGKLRTGIPWIDQVIEADNPHGRTRRPLVLSPDLPSARTITSVSGS